MTVDVRIGVVKDLTLLSDPPIIIGLKVKQDRNPRSSRQRVLGSNISPTSL